MSFIFPERGATSAASDQVLPPSPETRLTRWAVAWSLREVPQYSV